MKEEQVYNLTHGIKNTPENLIALGLSAEVIQELKDTKEALRAERERVRKLEGILREVDEDGFGYIPKLLILKIHQLLSRKDGDGSNKV